MRIRNLLAALLCAVMTISLFPALSPTAEAEETLTLAYEVDFNGTDGIFEPAGLSGAFDNFTYTPSADGRTLTIKGKDYDGSDPDGIQKQAYWGGNVKGLTAGRKTTYELTYKVRNDSTKNYSQVGIGGLVPDTGVPTAFWNVASTYNASGSVVLSMLSGNRSGISASNANRTTLRQNADRDEEGFIDMKIAFNGPTETMVLYTKVGGVWEELFERGIEMRAGSHMGIIFYSLRSGAINMTVRDMKIYASGGKQASTTETPETDDIGVTGYADVPKEMTLAEVKPRYGVEKKLVADGIKAVPVFRNEMDAYAAEIPYAKNKGIELADGISTDGYEDLYVTFSAAVSEADAAIHTNPDQIRLEVTKDGKTWLDSGVSFTAEAAGETLVAAEDVPEDSEGNYLFEQTTQIPVYRFTSGNFDAAGIKNIRLVPGTEAVNGTFRLVSLYVWGDTGETVRVPLLDGNLNPTVKKTDAAGSVAYELYSTDFSDTNGWVTNAVNWREKHSVTVGGTPHPHCYFVTAGALPVMDGMNLRIYSPDMKLDPSLYDEINVAFCCFRSKSEGDPAITPLQLGYSTDNGATWTTMSKAPTRTVLKDERAVDGSNYSTYLVELDVKPYLPQDQIVTNIVILPYGDDYWYKINLINNDPDLLRRDDGPMLNSKGAFRLLDFSLTGVSGDSSLPAEAVPVYRKDYDSSVLQLMIDTAKAQGETEVTIPSVNPRDGSDTWIITRTLKIPSDMTLYINNCKLRMGDYAMCRMIQNQHCTAQTAAYEDRNIHIVGVGDAILQGGVHNGIRTETVEGSTLSTWDNMTLVLQNVDGFSVKNLRVEESRFYSVALYYCSNGVVDGIDLFNSRKLYVDGIETWEQDGIDIRPGTHDVWVNDITGRSGDDSVALVAIRAGNFEVVDKDIDIRNIVVTNVATKMARLRMNVRITACNGLEIYNVLLDGIRDTQSDFGGKLSRNTVQIGNSATGYIVSGGRAMEAGEIRDIYLRNITGSTPYPIGVRHTEVNDSHWAYEYDSCTNLYSGADASLISYGDQKTHTIIPTDCSHVWTRKLTGTQHLQGLPASAAAMDWYGCAGCNAVKVPDTRDLNLSSARLTKNSTSTNRMYISFPIPSDMICGDTYTYTAALYANPDFTGRIGSAVSGGSLADYDYCEGDPLVLTLLSEKPDELTIGGYDGSSYTTLPSGTYYAEITLVIDGVPYAGRGAVSWTQPAPEKIDFAFARMILGNALDMQFAFPKAGVESGAYVEVVRTAADGSKVAQTIPYADFKTATISGVAHYYVTYSGIAAKEMADTIVATVYAADGTAISNGWTDSVRAYALRSLRAANATTKNKTMLVDMLNYGAAAQVYFTYNADDLANKDLTADELALGTTADACVNEVVKGAKNRGSRLILESSIKVQQAFTGLNEGMYATVEFTNYNGRKVSETIPGSEFQLGAVSIIELDQIVLADARTLYTLTIYNADGTVYDTHTDSVASYIARASSNDLYVAIMNFADGAYNYLKS